MRRGSLALRCGAGVIVLIGAVPVARADGEKTPDAAPRAPQAAPDSGSGMEHTGDAAPSWLRGRPQLGADVVPVDPALAAQFKAPRPSAMLLTHVEDGGPAQRAGLLAGDLLLRIDGRDVMSVEDIDAALAAHDGASVEVEIWRRERRETAHVVLAPYAGLFPHRPNVEDHSADIDALRRELREMRRELDDLRHEVDVLRRQR